MQEIILYAVLALIVGAMLFSVLGKNVGQDSDQNSDQNSDKNKRPILDPENLLRNLEPKDASAPAPEFEGPAAEGLKAIYAADKEFSVPVFLDGAKTVYGMILEAYADGDKDILENLLNAQVKEAYYAAIDEREEKDLSQTTDLARLVSAEIVSASRTGKTGRIGVVYLAELATALVDKNGEIVSGDLDVLSRVKEVWSYERTLSSKNPNWVLCSVEPHDTLEGETDGPDHSPDIE
ncbi:MAG: hypothetical protein COA69_10440 [Robiginitomaculum sp.]|nr:MAG: hypothetical protein COA69_10440 [Robiginitomaculum sp.]